MSSTQKRATFYLDPTLHRALRLKAAETDRSLSDIVNEALKLSLYEDAEDLAAVDERANEPNLLFEDVVAPGCLPRAVMVHFESLYRATPSIGKS